MLSRGLLSASEVVLKRKFFPVNTISKNNVYITNGHSDATNITNEIGIKSNGISKYLSVLNEHGLIEKKFPVINPSKKTTRFFVSDSFFGFWSLFIWSYYNEIESGVNENAKDSIKKNIGKIFGFRFERLILDLIQKNQFIGDYKTVGTHWGEFKGEKGKNTYEIDIVALNDSSNEILFCECKWSNNVDAEKILSGLKEKAKHVDLHTKKSKIYGIQKTQSIFKDNNKQKETFVIFAKGFITKEVKGVKLFDLKDLEKIFTS